MVQSLNLVGLKSRKRKAPGEAHTTFSFDELNQDLLERVLSWLPTSSFFRLRSVCKSWSSITNSATFRIACSHIPFRDPWLLMVDQDLDQSIVYDTSEGDWKAIDHLNPVLRNCYAKSIPVASSGGLVCFRDSSGNFVICNPVTGACRELPPASPFDEGQNLHAVAMSSAVKDLSSYKIVLVSGEISNLTAKVFDSSKQLWEDVVLVRKAESSPETDMSGEETVYFLSKAGDVVATNMQRSPSKQYSSVLTTEAGEEVINFLSHTGSIIACNLALRTFVEYPRLLPVYSEYSIDVVECKGSMLVVILSEFLETASLRMWKLSKGDRGWMQVAAMPPAMSHEFYGKKADINCVGSGENIFICISSDEFSCTVMCDVVMNEWIELPRCYVNGKAKEFMSAFSFQPRVEASV